MVSIIYECGTSKSLDLDCENLARTVAEGVLSREGCPYDVQVSLTLIDDAAIHEINRKFRGIDRATDVLSFPAVPFESPCDYSIVEEDASYFDLDTDELLLGDILISAEHVTAQAAEYGHSVKREFCFLVAHSMLHLLGYDHMEAGEAAVMEEKQAAVLDGLGITR